MVNGTVGTNGLTTSEPYEMTLYSCQYILGVGTRIRMFRVYGTNHSDLLHSLAKPISFVCSAQELITCYGLRVFYYHHDTLSLRLVALLLSKTNWLVFLHSFSCLSLCTYY